MRRVLWCTGGGEGGGERVAKEREVCRFDRGGEELGLCFELSPLCHIYWFHLAGGRDPHVGLLDG